MKHIRALKSLGACDSAIEFASQFETLDAAWQACERGDWMLWLVGKTTKGKPWSDERKLLVKCAMECAETVKHLWSESQKTKVEAAVTVIKNWCDGNALVEDAQQARLELKNIAVAADAAYAAAAYAAAYAAAAYAAAYAAAAAAYAAADAAAYAAIAAAAAADDVQKKCADIVRSHFPHAPSL